MPKKELASDIIQRDALDICQKTNLNYLKGKTILVTGASGLLGTYFLASLKKYADLNKCAIKIIAVVYNQLPGHLNIYKKDKRFSFLRGDLTNHNFLAKLPKADIIIHSAGYAQPGRFLDDKIRTLKINTLATFFLLEKLKKNGRFLFVSTSELYSGANDPPFKESDIGSTGPDHPRACYIESKRCGEAVSLGYREKGYDIKIARLALAYGPGTRKNDQRVLNSLIQKAMENKKINLMDQGEAVRTYCYIADVIETLWKILLFGREAVYNVGGTSKIKIYDLAKKIGEILNVPVIKPHKDLSLAGAPKEVELDLSRIEKEFKKKKFIRLDRGLQNTICWLKKNIFHQN